MNRAARRAFAKRLARAMGRAEAHRPAEDAGPTVEERLAKLEAEKEALERRLAGLEERHDQVPGVTPGRRDWHVIVGGEKVEVKAISPAEWIATTQELPEFLFSLAVDKLTPETERMPAEERAQKVGELARRWIRACAVDPDSLNLDRLTVMEAEHAVAQIAELNGVTAYLAKWFRSRLESARVAAAASDRPGVRAEAEQPAGGAVN